VASPLLHLQKLLGMCHTYVIRAVIVLYLKKNIFFAGGPSNLVRNFFFVVGAQVRHTYYLPLGKYHTYNHILFHRTEPSGRWSSPSSSSAHSFLKRTPRQDSISLSICSQSVADTTRPRRHFGQFF
jgi:hypothetical protein